VAESVIYDVIQILTLWLSTTWQRISQKIIHW